MINGEAGPIYYLEVHGGATLLITPRGSLTIDGVGKYEDAILLVGSLKNQGEIRLVTAKNTLLAGHPENLLNTGKITSVFPPKNR